jgi:hypothetical protein
MLWQLAKRIEFEWSRPDNPWKSAYDVCEGFVVRAESEGKARQYASEQAGDEGKDAWLDAKFSHCEQLEHFGSEGVILRDFRAG